MTPFWQINWLIAMKVADQLKTDARPFFVFLSSRQNISLSTIDY